MLGKKLHSFLPSLVYVPKYLHLYLSLDIFLSQNNLKTRHRKGARAKGLQGEQRENISTNRSLTFVSADSCVAMGASRGLHGKYLMSLLALVLSSHTTGHKHEFVIQIIVHLNAVCSSFKVHGHIKVIFLLELFFFLLLQ